MLLWIALSCGEPTPSYCRDRADDADCDGVPDAGDHCPDSPLDARHDAVGCTETQAAGCRVELLAPEDGATLQGDARFAWNGTCEVYLLQFAEDPSFPPGATRTAVRTVGTEVISSGREPFWRVVGGLSGKSAGAATVPRALVSE